MFLQNNAQVFAELKSVRQHQIETDIQLNKTNRRIDELFDRMDKYSIDETQGVFFQGQIFDAYAKFESIIAKAEKEIILIDNSVLYHIGASLKDLGKKCFAFEIIDSTFIQMIFSNSPLQKSYFFLNYTHIRTK